MAITGTEFSAAMTAIQLSHNDCGVVQILLVIDRYMRGLDQADQNKVNSFIRRLVSGAESFVWLVEVSFC